MSEALEPMFTGEENELQIFAVMCRPSDPASLLAELALQIDAERGGLAEVVRNPSVGLAAYSHIHKESFRPTSDVVAEAAVAGLTLTLLFWMHGDDVSTPSLEKAQWLTRAQAKRHTYTGGRKIGFSRAAVKHYWAEHKRVVHLWAAYQILTMRRVEKAAPLPTIADNPKKFLATAKAMQLFAEGYRPAYTRKPQSLLPGDTWRIGPAIEPVQLKTPPLPADLLNDLEHYRNE